MRSTGLLIDWNGPARQPCPVCDRGPKDRSCGIKIEPDGAGVAHCFRCGYVETFRPDRSPSYGPGKPVLRPVEARKHETLSDWGRELWAATNELSGVATAYLRARTCVVPPKGTHLRWLPELKHPCGHVGPALIGLVTHVHTREPLSLHRTWIKPNGDKADVDPPRLLLKDHNKGDGVIRLWPDEHVGAELAIAEGVETGLSLAHAVEPVWACIDAGNLKAFPALPGVEILLIGADNDAAGIAAARACAQRWAVAGKQVRIAVPETSGADLNDLARAA